METVNVSGLKNNPSEALRKGHRGRTTETTAGQPASPAIDAFGVDQNAPLIEPPCVPTGAVPPR